MNNKIEINYNNSRDIPILIESLSANGYIVKVTPVYETEEQIKSRAPRSRYALKSPNIDHYDIELVGKVEQPVYYKEEICSECGCTKDNFTF